MFKRPKLSQPKEAPAPRRTLRQRTRRLFWRGVFWVVAIVVALVALGTFINPPATAYMIGEKRRLGTITYTWAGMEDIAPVMARAAVAAEDANFCLHMGFDVTAIRAALAEGSARGASTITQQTVKNVYLWHGRSWVRKGMEAALTPLVELIWSKERILEVYLNIAEFDEGVFGVHAAADHYFDIHPRDLSATQAARLAAILPSPKKRSAANPSTATRKRARKIIDGAATIRKDGRADCFES